MSATADLFSLAPNTAGWLQDAACRDADPDLFFAVDDRSRQQALGLCASCPVRSACLEQALTAREPYGIWGGTDEHDRKRLLRQRRRAA